MFGREVFSLGMSSSSSLMVGNLPRYTPLRSRRSLPFPESAKKGIGILVTEQASNFTEFERRLQ